MAARIPASTGTSMETPASSHTDRSSARLPSRLLPHSACTRASEVPTMSTEAMSPKESARQLAEILVDVMNMTAVLQSEPALQASDPVELRSALLRIVDEMTW